MNNTTKHLDKKLKPAKRKALVITPPGLHSITMDEIITTMENRPVPGRSVKFEMRQEGNKIFIHDIHFRDIFFLALHLKTAYDCLLCIHEARVHNKEELEREISGACCDIYWPSGTGFCLKVETNKSILYHDGLIKETAVSALAQSGFLYDENSGQKLFIKLEHNKLSLYLSLAGIPLYKRGYRVSFNTNAPLREDIAASLIFPLLNNHRDGLTVFVPFCGSGTIAWESFISLLNVPNLIWERNWAFSDWTYNLADDARYYKKKGIERMTAECSNIDFYLIDINPEAVKEASANLAQIKKILSNNNCDKVLRCTIAEDDAIKLDWDIFLKDTRSPVFIGLNPPYGWRIKSGFHIYLKIAENIIRASSHHSLFGFILCPDEKSWALMNSRLKNNFVLKTNHFSLGGRDLRALYFKTNNEPLVIK